MWNLKRSIGFENHLLLNEDGERLNIIRIQMKVSSVLTKPILTSQEALGDHVNFSKTVTFRSLRAEHAHGLLNFVTQCC